MMEDPGVPSVTIEMNGTAARLLVKLMSDLGAADPMAVLSRALGLLEMVQHSKRHGGRLCFVNDRGDVADVVF